MIEFPLTDEQYEKAQTKLRERGIDLAGKAGTMSRQGVTASYEHKDGKLSIAIVEKPMFLPEKMVEDQIKSSLQKVLEGL